MNANEREELGKQGRAAWLRWCREGGMVFLEALNFIGVYSRPFAVGDS
jgi:hypothetical protein